MMITERIGARFFQALNLQAMREQKSRIGP